MATVNIDRIKRKWKRKWESAVKELEQEDIASAADTWSTNAAAKEDEWHRELEEAYKLHKFARGVLSDEAKRDWATETWSGLQRKVAEGLSDRDVNRFASRAAPYISLVKWAKSEFNKIAFPDPATKAKEWIDIIVLLKKAKGEPEKVPEVKAEIEKKLAELKERYGIAEALKVGVPKIL